MRLKSPPNSSLYFFAGIWLITAAVKNARSLPDLQLVELEKPEKTVELAIFIDQYLYHYWLTNIGLSASPVTYGQIQNFIQSYLDVLMQSLNLIYAHPSIGSSGSLLGRSSSSERHAVGFVPLIGFHLSHTQLFWRGDPTNVHPDLRENAPNYLDSFCEFAEKENRNKMDGSALWDHALLLTGVDLKFPNGTNYGVAGISWDNSMCNKTYSCSVVEGKTFRSVLTAVHEIGHSLGIEHDGLKYNSKCSPTGYIMSQAGLVEDANTVGKIAWSSCSKNNLRAFLTTAPNVLSNQVECLEDRPSVKWSGMGRVGRGQVGVGKDSPKKKTMPGEIFNVEEQCKLGGGKHWIPSRRKSHVKKMCSTLYCNNTVTHEVLPFHPALEGTPCGKRKICKFGECKLLLSTQENLAQSQYITTILSFFSSLIQKAKEKLSFD